MQQCRTSARRSSTEIISNLGAGIAHGLVPMLLPVSRTAICHDSCSFVYKHRRSPYFLLLSDSESSCPDLLSCWLVCRISACDKGGNFLSGCSWLSLRKQFAIASRTFKKVKVPFRSKMCITKNCRVPVRRYQR